MPSEKVNDFFSNGILIWNYLIHFKVLRFRNLLFSGLTFYLMKASVRKDAVAFISDQSDLETFVMRTTDQRVQ